MALYPRSGTNRQWQQRGGYDPFTEVSGSARYLRLPPARKADLEGSLRVDLVHSLARTVQE